MTLTRNLLLCLAWKFILIMFTFEILHSHLHVNVAGGLVPVDGLLVHPPGLLLLLHLGDVINSLHLHGKPQRKKDLTFCRDSDYVINKETQTAVTFCRLLFTRTEISLSHLEMNAVSGRMTLKKTSLATSSVFSTVLVTKVEAYLTRVFIKLCS